MSESKEQRRAKAFEPLIRDKMGLLEHAEETSDVQIENCVGFVKVPVGLAGPLLVSGPNTPNENVYAPLATTEAALVASCSRGCKAFSACGGLQFEVLGDRMSRAPVFNFPSPREAIDFAKRLPEFQEEIAEAAESTSNHLRFQRMTPHVVGSDVHLHLSYYCGDAAGQNMVTIASQVVCEMLSDSPLCHETKLQHFAVEGQMSSDKKASAGLVMAPRGMEVMAWGTLTNTVCEDIFGMSSYHLYLGSVHSREGGIRNGQFGSGVNATNVIAAMFIAAGQDPACVVDSCWSQFIPEYDIETEDLKFSIYMPSLPVGVMGGGTGYQTQKECLQILGCSGEGMKGRLAGLIASFSLALDVSTTAAVLNNTFSQSHQRLARPARKDKQKSSKL